MFRRIAASTLLVLTIAACGVGSDPVDSIEVTSLSPADGATGVSVNVQLAATFDRAIDETTLEGNFTLSDPSGDVAGTIGYDEATLTATFTPDAALAFDTTYTATIAGSVATAGGETLEGDASWSFTTMAEGNAIGAIVVEPENPDPIAVDGNTTVQLTATATGVTGAPDTSVTWSTVPAEGVVTVDSTGLVTAVAAGTAEITATSNFDDSLAGTVTVTVAEPLVAGSNYLLSIDAGIAIDPVLTPDDPDRVVNSGTPLFTGGVAPFSYEVSETPETEFTVNGLPPGITLASDTGTISGTPTTAGFYREAILVTDAAGQTIEMLAEIRVLFVFEYANTPYTYDPTTTGEVVVPAGDVTIEGELSTLTFSMTLTGSDSADAVEETFSIASDTGAITQALAETSAATTYTYTVAVCDDGLNNCALGEATATFDITFNEVQEVQ